MNMLFDSSFFHLGLCIFIYGAALTAQKRTGWLWLNPLLITILAVIAVLVALDIPYASFQSGTSLISIMLTPATCVLAVPMVKQFEVMKKNLGTILIGTFLGALSSMLSVMGLCHVFNLDTVITNSLLPKSVTTPIAISVSEVNGGLAAITVAAVILTGILGSVLIPLIFRRLKVKNSVTLGITMGTASHALGTSRAVEIGEQEGGLAGLAIGMTGLFTVFLSLIFHL